MSGGPAHDRSKLREQAATRAGDRGAAQRRHGRTLQQAAGNQAVAALAHGAAPLSPGSREPLEREYDVDLSRVRLHTGSEAERETSAQRNVAFTRGDDVFLSERAARDPLVVGHELVHVIQQLRPANDSAEAGLEVEATAVSAGEAEAIAGGAPFGSVQGFDLFGDDEEKAREEKRRDEDAEALVHQRGVLDSPEEWKKHIDDPAISGWLRRHPDRLDPFNEPEKKDFRRWLVNPKGRPSGATATAQPPPQVQLKGPEAISPTEGRLAFESRAAG